jgi:hypothetical protein
MSTCPSCLTSLTFIQKLGLKSRVANLNYYSPAVHTDRATPTQQLRSQQKIKNVSLFLSGLNLIRMPVFVILVYGKLPGQV